MHHVPLDRHALGFVLPLERAKIIAVVRSPEYRFENR